MGSAVSRQALASPAVSAVPGTEPRREEIGGACPVDHSKMVAAAQENQARACPVDHAKMAASTGVTDVESSSAEAVSAPPQDKCPVPHDKRHKLYDVCSQELNPDNMMPATPNQLPSPGQTVPLEIGREVSSIPKGHATTGAEQSERWVYPSPQMFYNALKRKGKADDVKEHDMDVVVRVHNNMNERTWKEVLEWERRFHCTECDAPSLVRFQGKPDQLSPAARAWSWLGYEKPFDRHDWVVDRCGTQVRYVIDYYYNEKKSGKGDPIEIDVRPALDSVASLVDRSQNRASIAMQGFRRLIPTSPAVGGASEQSSITHPSTSRPVEKKLPDPSQTVSDAKEFEFLTSLTTEKLGQISQEVGQKCAKAAELVAACNAGSATDQLMCEQAQVGMTYCMGTVICPDGAEKFMKALTEGGGNEAAAFDSLHSCIERFQVMATRVRKQGKGVYELGPEKLVYLTK
ncbi:Cytochrome c-type heme lyase [Porphyridium purpureum]|uniref:Holocytochrome c-type synthase n=1 Tax=Porphyridium purpureum TaxID=35688 RepID=A0A5J4YQT6_PORPP|nr:Cytochrome c-type heme lyase [Porphyridium purpureum]|eukprot:POR4834..scf236_6